MVLSTTDITAISGVVIGSVSLALIVYKTLKEKPKIEIEFVSASWHKRAEHSIATTFGIHVRIHNKGERNTTIHSAILEINQKGQKFQIDTEHLDVVVTSSSSTLKQLIFNLGVEQIEINDDITNSTLVLNHTRGTKKMQIPLIKKP